MIFKSLKQKLQSTSEWIKTSLYFGLTLLSVFILSHYVKFLISETDSLPYHFFLHLPRIKPQKEDYTMVDSAWYQRKIIKKIIGVAGDSICLQSNGQVFVNKLKVGLPVTIASDGRKLKAIQAQVIPKGYVFLYGTHPKSFDSRYEELGLIPLSSLNGLVVPLY